MTDDSFDPRYDPVFQRGFDRARPGTSPAGQRGIRDSKVESPPAEAPSPSAPATEEPVVDTSSMRDWTRDPTRLPAREPIWVPTREPTRMRGIGESAVPRVPTRAPVPEVYATDATAPADTAAPGDNDQAARPGMVLRGNPFIYALIGVGVFLMLLGLWGQWGAADGRTGSYRSPDELVLDEFLAGIGPWCMTIGIGTLVTVLVLYALHWRTPK
ncbi:hypothetical protein [Diaminobutyricimonas sp. LJ205]|uniref:hypothetical protein n=1 Tax=Diaminobutyricimonas sp. LJ205 TaxID=2683590 RepID=UPI0012F4C49E|nr:hypothetical protein [Diaminobutyricimonas sp. LJ205]